jgi:hypothetical protein
VFLDLGAAVTRFRGRFNYDFVKETLQTSGHFLIFIGGANVGHALVVYGVGVGPDGEPSRDHFSVMDPIDCTYRNRSFLGTRTVYLGLRTQPGADAACK